MKYISSTYVKHETSKVCKVCDHNAGGYPRRSAVDRGKGFGRNYPLAKARRWETKSKMTHLMYSIFFLFIQRRMDIG